MSGKTIQNRFNSGRAALSAALAALALILAYVEALLPFNFGIPGVKLGLPNLVVLTALYTVGTGCAFFVNIVRIILSGMLFGGFSAMLYSLAGGLLSFAVMLLLIRTGLFSPVGVSMAGGAAHNFGQVTAAALISGTPAIYFYFPVLLITGTIAGITMGFIASLIINRLKRI